MHVLTQLSWLQRSSHGGFFPVTLVCVEGNLFSRFAAMLVLESLYSLVPCHCHNLNENRAIQGKLETERPATYRTVADGGRKEGIAGLDVHVFLRFVR